MEALKVFISYSHDSPEHAERVLGLSDRLRQDGIDSHIDQYEVSPPEGWPRWMLKRVKWADFVLVACTATYNQRFTGEAPAGEGKGVKWEGAILTQELYDAEAQNTKFIPVVLGPQDTAYVPVILQGQTYYDVSTDKGYEQLYRHLTNQPRILKPVLGKLKSMSPLKAQQAEASYVNVCSIEKKRCFVIMPFSKKGTVEYNRNLSIYQDMIKPVVNECGYEAIRADEMEYLGNITRDIIEHLHKSDLVVADLSGKNANVFYELGVRHALYRSGTIPLIKEGETLPFDIANYRAIFYSIELKGPEQFKKELKLRIKAFERVKNEKSDNPVHDILDDKLSNYEHKDYISQKVYNEKLKEIDSLKLEIETLRKKIRKEKQLTKKIVIGNETMTFVYIFPGKFMMGSPNNERERDDDETLHLVTLTQGFWMQTTPVTQGLWREIMDNNPSKFSDYGNDYPVEKVSWNNVQEFIKELNKLDSKNVYRLPTESEWEYAARAETTTPFAFGECLFDNANYNGHYPLKGCPTQEYLGKTTPVTCFKPNTWGLYDMHGNVCEWCHDWYGRYPSSSAIDPIGPSTGSAKVFRGGSWDDYERDCRSAYRSKNNPSSRHGNIGFRLVLLIA